MLKESLFALFYRTLLHTCNRTPKQYRIMYVATYPVSMWGCVCMSVQTPFLISRCFKRVSDGNRPSPLVYLTLPGNMVINCHPFILISACFQLYVSVIKSYVVL